MKRLFLVFALIGVVFSLAGCNGSDMVAKATESRSTKIGWGLKKVENAQPEVPDSWIQMLKKYDGYYLGNTKQKVMYLTFDEGYENGYTGKILDVLKKTNTPAAFFVTGPYIKNEAELVKRMVDDGHIVGNHTVNHPSMPDLSESEIQKELGDLNRLFYDVTKQNMKYMRPPRGEFSEISLETTKKCGYKSIFWSIAYADWDTNMCHGGQYAVDKVTKQFHNGAIILLHAVSKDNAEGLEEIINTAKNQGYTFKSLDEL